MISRYSWLPRGGDRLSAKIKLTAEQRAVVDHPRGHARVVAVAGSGKTQTMVMRCLDLVQNKGVSPDHIKILMYNKDAQLDFSRRLRATAVGWRPGNRMVQTHHAFAFSLLHGLVGQNNVRLEVGSGRQNNLMRQAIRETGQCSFNDLPSLLADLGLLIEFAKAKLITPKRAAEQCGHQFSEHVYKAAELFEQLRARAGIRFFSDLTVDALSILKRSSDKSRRVARQWKYFIVDEYQDINEAQQQLLMQAARASEIMVVGDPDQCIYEWRGADPSFIQRRFFRDVGGCETYYLSRTFRYGDALSMAANSVICRNRADLTGQICVSDRSTPQTHLEVFNNKRSPLSRIIHTIERWLESGRSLDEVVVLAKRWGCFSALQLQLLSEGVPFRFGAEGKSIQNGALFRGVVAFLRLARAAKPGDVPVGDRKDTAIALISLIVSVSDSDIPEHALSGEGRGWVDAMITLASDLLSGKMKWIIKPFSEAIVWAMGWKRKGKVKAFLDGPVLNIFDRYINGAMTQDGKDRRGDLLNGIMAFFETKNKNVMEAYEALSSLESSPREEGQAEGRLLLTTPFKAKGCEWPLVIVWDLVDGIFPDHRTPLEAERRLFYVSMTRAIERLVLFDDVKYPCRFVAESNIPTAVQIGDALRSSSAKKPLTVKDPINASLYKKYLKEIKSDLSLESPTPRPPSRSSDPTSAVGGLKVGDLIRHTRYGEGTIIHLAISHDRGITATVRFPAKERRIHAMSIALLKRVLKAR